MRATVLILDDIGVEVSREWVNTTLYQLINYRYLNLCKERNWKNDR